MSRRLSAFMGGHPARAAGGLGLGRPLEFARAVRDWFRAGEKKPGLPGARPHSQARARDGSVGVGCARAERTASARACSGVAARPRAMMSPPQVTSQYQSPAAPFGEMLYVNAGSGARVTGSRAWVSNSNMTRHPAWARHPDPRAARRQVNARRRQSLWSKLLTLELLSATAFRAERHPTMRSGPRDLRCSECSPAPEIYS
jgi:hypothetical protein